MDVQRVSRVGVSVRRVRIYEPAAVQPNGSSTAHRLAPAGTSSVSVPSYVLVVERITKYNSLEAQSCVCAMASSSPCLRRSQQLGNAKASDVAMEIPWLPAKQTTGRLCGSSGTVSQEGLYISELSDSMLR
jgi:hypothetical protein